VKIHVTVVVGLFSILAVAGCSGGGGTGSSSPPLPVSPTAPPAQACEVVPDPSGGRIQHVIVVIQENRSFDNLFATFPGADGTTRGTVHTGQQVFLTRAPLVALQDIYHTYSQYLASYDRGRMDGFDLSRNVSTNKAAGTYPYQYVNPAQISPYWTLAKRYTLADHLFMTQGSDSFTAHQDLIAGGTQISPSRSIVNAPDALPWGCDAPPGTVTSLVTYNGIFLANQGPFPCLQYRTLRDLLDAKHVSWRYYTPSLASGSSASWNAFEAISAVRYGSQWHTNISSPDTNILRDAAGGDLAAVSWVVPEAGYSDHPGEPVDTGPSWVGQIVNAVGGGKYWDSTAIVVVWDDWGGFYDHVPPRQLDFGGLGFRVPMIVVSPYALHGHVSHTPYEFGSVLRFVERVWSLGCLGTSDARATSIDDAFDFTQVPGPFVPIPATESKASFLHERHSNLPVDDM
jgi:phospholipase C